MKERIRQVMERTGLTQQDFSNRLGISPASLSNIFVGRTNPTNNHVQAIHRAFPEINVSWLLFGEGDMLGEVPSLGIDGRNATTNIPEVPDEMSIMSAEASALDFIDDSSMRTSPSPMGYTSSYTPQKREIASIKPATTSRMELNTHISAPAVRKIREIRVFFDDGTYEAFVPLNEK